MSDDDLQKAGDQLFNLIYNAVKVVSFAHENDQMWSREWVDLMFYQGSERYIEFYKRLTGEISADIPPQKYPISIHKSFDLLNDIENAIQDNEDDKSFVRGQIMENSNALLKIKRKVVVSIGDKLKDLVDEQAVHVRIDWQEFCNQVLQIIQSGRDEIIEEGEMSIKPWV